MEEEDDRDNGKTSAGGVTVSYVSTYSRLTFCHGGLAGTVRGLPWFLIHQLHAECALHLVS